MLRERGKRREKTQIMINHKTFMKTHNFPKTKHQLPHKIKKKLNSEVQGVCWDLSMMIISNKLTKRTTKTVQKKSTNNKKRKTKKIENE